jgi:hypothetical protein
VLSSLWAGGHLRRHKSKEGLGGHSCCQDSVVGEEAASGFIYDAGHL